MRVPGGVTVVGDELQVSDEKKSKEVLLVAKRCLVITPLLN